MSPEKRIKLAITYLHEKTEFICERAKKILDGDKVKIGGFPNFELWHSNRMKEHAKLLEKKRTNGDLTGCCYCSIAFNNTKNSTSRTREHVIPISKGGLDSADNIEYACSQCNSWKSDKTPAQWLKELLKYVRSRNPKKIKKGYTIDRIGIMIGRIRKMIKDVKNLSNTEKEKRSIYKNIDL